MHGDNVLKNWNIIIIILQLVPCNSSQLENQKRFWICSSYETYTKSQSQTASRNEAKIVNSYRSNWSHRSEVVLELATQLVPLDYC